MCLRCLWCFSTPLLFAEKSHLLHSNNFKMPRCFLSMWFFRPRDRWDVNDYMLHDFWTGLAPLCPLCMCMRPCLNELQKEYWLKTKVIVLEWQWVTLGSWCQMNRNGHSSPVKHKVEGKPHKILEKLNITSGKSTFFWHLFVKYF